MSSRFLPLLYASTLFLFQSCVKERDIPETFLPIPDWLPNTEIVRLDTLEEVSGLWQSKDRCCIDKDELVKNQREFYASCYDLIARSPGPQIVFKCLYLMDNGMEKATRRHILDYIANNYYSIRTSTEHCANCSPSDDITRAIRQLAMMESQQGEHQMGIARLKKLLHDKTGDITDWVELEVLESLAYIYTRTPAIEQRDLDFLIDSLQKFEYARTSDGARKSGFQGLERYLQKLQERAARM